MIKELLTGKKLLASGVVANNRMNRLRVCLGKNSYEKDLALNPIEFLRKRATGNRSVSWLDICCGEGRALIEAATIFAGLAREGSFQITGIDLAGMFQPYSAEFDFLSLVETSIEDFEPAGKFDLITCVHGLHYIGDKLSVIQKAAHWLKEDGIFSANLDLRNLKLAERENSSRMFSNYFKKQGFSVDNKKHLLMLQGSRAFDLPFEYIGADDQAGPNYTGQPVVDSYYK